MKPKILWVDDELSLVGTMKRQLRGDYEIEGALNGPEALMLLGNKRQYAVIVSDLKMPGMDGITFLAQAKHLAPDSVRIMLTGYAELDTAIDAVNNGEIFRFLTKPSTPETLDRSLRDAVRQHELITAEHVLLEQTLMGSIQVLTEVLALANPVAFSRAVRVRGYVEHMARALNLRNSWQVTTAAMLHHLGYVTLPGPVLEKHYAGRSMSDSELAMLNGQLDTTTRLLTKIPRLEEVNRIITDHAGSRNSPAVRMHEPAALAAHVLRVALEFDELVLRGVTATEALRQLVSRIESFNPDVVQALAGARPSNLHLKQQIVQVDALKDGMIVDEDVRTSEGILLVPKGYAVNEVVRQRLRNFRLQGEIEDSVAIVEPA